MRAHHLILIAGVTFASAGRGLAEPAAPAGVECTAKPFPNLPDKATLRISRQPDGSYKLDVDNFGKKKTKAKLTCSFHPADPRVFACRQARDAWGVASTHFTEKGVEPGGKATESVGYAVEGVRAPAGEPKTEFEMRFPVNGCVPK
jgi:hypothetical protein